MIKILAILALALTVLVGSHVLIHASVVRAFGIAPGPLRSGLLAALLVLSLSFPLGLIAARTLGGPLGDAAFTFGSLWAGVAVNALVVAALGWTVAGLLRVAGRTAPVPWVGVGALAVVVVLVVWGAWAAFHPRITEVEVPIAGLPDAWAGRRLVHLSDLHLGAVRGRGLLRRVQAQVDAVDPDLVVITGDLFDGPAGDYKSFLGDLDRLAAGHPVYAVLGNHELYNRTGKLLQRTRIRVLRDEVVDLDGLQLVGVSYPGLADEAALERLRRDLDRDRAAVLLFHTPTDVYLPAAAAADRHVSTYWVVDTDCALDRELGIDLQLSGHTHAGQLFPFGLLTRLIYHGRDRGLHRDGDFHLLVSSGTGTFGPPLRTAGHSETVVITLVGG